MKLSVGVHWNACPRLVSTLYWLKVMSMENGPSAINSPNQEDKSGRPTYASSTSRNSSTIDPRSIEVEPGPRPLPGFQSVVNRIRNFFKRG